MVDLLQRFSEWLAQNWQSMLSWTTSDLFYTQLAGILAAVALAALVAFVATTRIPVFAAAPAGRVLIGARSFLFRFTASRTQASACDTVSRL